MNMFESLRKIFASFRTEEEERIYSRMAFFNFIGFIAVSVTFSFFATKIF